MVDLSLPGNVIRISQFSVGTIFSQDLRDMMYRLACRRRFPNNLSEGRHFKEKEGKGATCQKARLRERVWLLERTNAGREVEKVACKKGVTGLNE